LEEDAALTPCAPAELRDGWAPVQQAIGRLALLPKSNLEVREKLALCFICPRWQWAAPLAPAPPPQIEKELATALLRSRCTWWCRARFFADRIMLHPRFGTALRCLAAAELAQAWRAPVIREAVSVHASTLQLTVARFDASGLWLHAAPGALPGIAAAVARAAPEAAQDAQSRGEGAVHGAFRPVLPAGGHAARVAARIVCLHGATRTRRDVEGLERVDVELTSSRAWKEWRGGLSLEQRTALSVWRGGAVMTPTRRWSQRDAARARCPWCPEPHCSARHLWAECPRLDARRAELAQRHGLQHGWWARQPRCVSKSGWLPRGASVKELIAANSMGICVASLASELRAGWRDG
jgi:hypothetical protein